MSDDKDFPSTQGYAAPAQQPYVQQPYPAAVQQPYPSAVQQPPAYTYYAGQAAGPSVYVAQPQAQYKNTAVVAGQGARDYLIISILNIIFCFWPIGIVALIKSIETRNHNNNGRYTEAQSSSRSAKKFNIIAFVVGIIVEILGGIAIIGSLIYRFTVTGVYLSSSFG